MTETFIPEEIALAAKKGAEYLDNMVYPEWYRAINLETLDLNNINTCVLGQLYGHYDTGWETLGLSRPRREELGFCVDLETGMTEAYERLTEAWSRIIRERRESDG